MKYLRQNHPISFLFPRGDLGEYLVAPSEHLTVPSSVEDARFYFGNFRDVGGSLHSLAWQAMNAGQEYTLSPDQCIIDLDKKVLFLHPFDYERMTA